MGFITDLPTTLVAAFRATLEEVLSADLILHVRDISHPDAEAQKRDVEAVLDRLGIDAGDRAARLAEVWNKVDLVPAARLEAPSGGRAAPGVSLVSAAGTEVEDLLRAIEQRLAANRDVVELDLDYGSSGELLAWLHRRGEVLEQTDDEDKLRLKVAITAPERARLAHKLGRPV